jgi:hypothetical protein
MGTVFMGRERKQLLGFLAALLIVAIPVSVALAVPSNFVRHENRYWTWYAPKHWGASFGKNGIDITSPTGTQIAGDAFSPIQCPSNLSSYFRQVRANLKSGGNLYAKPLRSARYTSVGGIRNVGGLKTQRSTYRGTRSTGAGIRGELFLIFSSGGGGCGLEGQIRAAPVRGFLGSIRTLRQIHKALRYHPS